MRWRRAGGVTAALILLLTLLTACADSGTVVERTWHEDSLGNSTCDLKIRPDDLDSAAYWVTNRRKKQCEACPPPSARWPSCAMSKEGNGGAPEREPEQPDNGIDWERGDPDRPLQIQGAPCSPEGAPAQTPTGVPMRCRDGKWGLS